MTANGFIYPATAPVRCKVYFFRMVARSRKRDSGLDIHHALNEPEFPAGKL